MLCIFALFCTLTVCCTNTPPDKKAITSMLPSTSNTIPIKGNTPKKDVSPPPFSPTRKSVTNKGGRDHLSLEKKPGHLDFLPEKGIFHMEL